MGSASVRGLQYHSL